MATSAPALARSSPSSGVDRLVSTTASGTTSAPPSASHPPQDGDIECLTLQACDDADSLCGVLSAYACIEKLIEPLELGDSELIAPTRTELAALIRLVNGEMARCITAIGGTLQAARKTFESQPAT